MAKKYSDELRETVLDLYDEGGSSIKLLTEEFNLGQGVLRYWIVARNKKKIKEAEIEKKRLRKMNETGIIEKKMTVEKDTMKTLMELKEEMNIIKKRNELLKTETDNLEAHVIQLKGKLMDCSNEKAKAIYDYEEMKKMFEEARDENLTLQIKLEEAEKFLVPEVINQPVEKLIQDQKEEIDVLKKAFKYIMKG